LYAEDIFFRKTLQFDFGQNSGKITFNGIDPTNLNLADKERHMIKNTDLDTKWSVSI